MLSDSAVGTLIGFGGGLAVVLIGALAAAFFQRRSDRQRRVEAARFDVYMKLLDVSSSYDQIVHAELFGESPRPEVQARLVELSWRIADKLRETDEIEPLEEILWVLLCEDFPSAQKRALAIEQLVVRLGLIVNPRYHAAIRAVSERNSRRMMEEPSFRPNAPGAA